MSEKLYEDGLGVEPSSLVKLDGYGSNRYIAE